MKGLNQMRRRAAGAGAVGATVAVIALVLGTGAGQAAPGPSEAFGVLVTGVIEPPRPHVKSTDGTKRSESLASLPENPLINAEVAAVTAGNSTASAKLLGVELLPGVTPGQSLAADSGSGQALSELASVCEQDPLPDELPPESADLLPPQVRNELDPAKLCAFFQTAATPGAARLDVLSVQCVGTTPEVQVAGLSVLGTEIPVPANPEPNTEIPLGALGSIVLNRQAVDNGLFTVQGAAVDLAGQASVILASASCGQPTSTKPTAPKPTPVTTNLPVTG